VRGCCRLTACMRCSSVLLNKLKAEASPDFDEFEYYRYHGKKYGYAYGYGVGEDEQARRGFFRRLLRRK